MPGRACGRTAGARMLVARVRLPGARRRGPAPPECVELSAGATKSGGAQLARRRAGELLLQVAHFGILAQLERAGAGGEAVRDPVRARERVGVARPRHLGIRLELG